MANHPKDMYAIGVNLGKVGFHDLEKRLASKMEWLIANLHLANTTRRW
jgi:hypothetical protein